MESKRKNINRALEHLQARNDVCKMDRNIIDKDMGDECDVYDGEEDISEVTGKFSDGWYEYHIQKAKEMTELESEPMDIDDMRGFICFSDEEDNDCDPHTWFDGYDEEPKMKRCHTAQDRPRITFNCPRCPLAKLLNATEATPITYKHKNGMYFKPAIIHLTNAERKIIKAHKVKHQHMMTESNFRVNGKRSRGIFVPSEYWAK